MSRRSKSNHAEDFSPMETKASGAPKLRIGLLGAARVSAKNAIAIANPESNCTVTAVASRSKEKAVTFVQQHVGAARSFGGEDAYKELIDSQGLVDAVYIPLPTTLHKEWVGKALKSSGKHVIVEKPVALNGHDFEEMMETARANKKFLMDGTMFPHHQRTVNVVACANDAEKIGTVKRIEASFSFHADPDFLTNDIRCRKDGDPLGCIGDLGWYCVRMALMVYGNRRAVSAQVVDWKLNNEQGVPLEASCFVNFEEDRALAFHCGFLSAVHQTVDIIGSKKLMRIEDFVLPRLGPLEYELHSTDFTDHMVTTLHQKEVIKETETDPPQEVSMWKTFARFCEAPEDAEAASWTQIALRNQQILDALMTSIQKDGAKIQICV